MEERTMMPTLSFNYVSEAVIGAAPTLGLTFPVGLELAALVPVGFAVGLAAVLIEAMRANRRAERTSRPTTIPAHHAA
jgi:hypothetical protein